MRFPHVRLYMIKGSIYYKNLFEKLYHNIQYMTVSVFNKYAYNLFLLKCKCLMSSVPLSSVEFLWVPVVIIVFPSKMRSHYTWKFIHSFCIWNKRFLLYENKISKWFLPTKIGCYIIWIAYPDPLPQNSDV